MTPLNRIERDPQPGNSYRMPNACHAVAGGGCTEAAPSVKREQETVKKRPKRGKAKVAIDRKNISSNRKTVKERAKPPKQKGGSLRNPKAQQKLLKPRSPSPYKTKNSPGLKRTGLKF